MATESIDKMLYPVFNGNRKSNFLGLERCQCEEFSKASKSMLTKKTHQKSRLYASKWTIDISSQHAAFSEPFRLTLQLKKNPTNDLTVLQVCTAGFYLQSPARQAARGKKSRLCHDNDGQCTCRNTKLEYVENFSQMLKAFSQMS